MTFKIFKNISELEKECSISDFIDFLYVHLDEFGDKKEAIKACIDYAFSKESGKGGFVCAAYIDNEMVGALIMNDTGMHGYIPDNILVYVAVRNDQRGKGVGKQLIEFSLQHTKGDVALHVEYDNPAKRLYERLGFTSKYAEMRLIK